MLAHTRRLNCAKNIDILNYVMISFDEHTEKAVNFSKQKVKTSEISSQLHPWNQ